MAEIKTIIIEQPIPWLVIKAYADHLKIDGSAFETFHTLICELDDEYRLVLAERRRSER